MVIARGGLYSSLAMGDTNEDDTYAWVLAGGMPYQVRPHPQLLRSRPWSGGEAASSAAAAAAGVERHVWKVVS